MKKALVTLFTISFLNAGAQEPSVKLSDYPTLDKLLEHKWTYEFKRSDLSIYTKWPIVESGLLFSHFDADYIVDLNTSDQWYFKDETYRDMITSRIKDSLLVYDLLDKVLIKNIYSGETYISIRKRSGRGGYTGYEAPYFLRSSQICYKEEDLTVLSYDVLNRKNIWRFTTNGDVIVNQPVLHNQWAIFCSESHMYFLNGETGRLVKKIQLADGIMQGSNINSAINVQGNFAYVWTEKNGIVAININKQEVVWKTINEEETIRATLSVLLDKDTLFTSLPGFLVSIDKNTGKILWKSDRRRISIPYKIALHSNYIFHYTKDRELNADLLCAFNRITKQTEFVGFTSKAFPPPTFDEQAHQQRIEKLGEVHPDDLQIPVLNELDEQALSLVNYTYNNLLIGTIGNKIHCFEIKSISE